MVSEIPLIQQQPALFYTGTRLIAEQATLDLRQNQLNIHLNKLNQTQTFSINDISLVQQQDKQLIIIFHNGHRLECQDPHPGLHRALQPDRLEKWLSHFHLSSQNKKTYIIGLILLLALLLYSTTRWTLPLITRSIIAITPEKHLDQWSQTLSAGMVNNIGGPSTLCDSLQTELRTMLFTEWIPDQSQQALPITLHFKSNLGINAMALPDGSIILSDGLLNFVSSKAELLGIIGHEIGHIRERHSLHHLLHTTLSTFFWDAITGDLSSSAGIAATAPLIFDTTHRSRTFERSADQFAINMMQAKELNPKFLANFFIKLHVDDQKKDNFDAETPPPLTNHCHSITSLDDYFKLKYKTDNAHYAFDKPISTLNDNQPWHTLFDFLRTHPNHQERLKRILNQRD